MILVTSVLLINVANFCQSYGFDGSPSCNPKVARRGRAQLIATIPCDLSVQSYCNLPGTLYPWHAVRRFVHENQGLMKRMYGDVKHISVLRTEINNNDIDVDDVEIAAARYSRSGWKKNKYLYTDYQNNKNNDVLTEPYFRPTSTSTTSKPAQITTQTVPSSGSRTTIIDENATTRQPPRTSSTSSKTVTDANAADVTNNIYGNITVTPMEANFKIVSAPNLSGVKNTSETATISTTLRIFMPAKHTEASITPPQDDIDDDATAAVSSTTESLIVTIKTSSTNRLQQVEDDQMASESNIYYQEESSEELESAEGAKDTNAKQATQNFRPPIVAQSTEHMEGQLFQDVVQKEAPAAPVLNTRGVNACPVKEEVVAPFWANNTRGEVLALLNLYPFEQYVHWEKCTNELKQMYCRDGCRCEQQYRLHRLLAYDPHNECRGIFSDWFRFPSCCICKCYDIPLEYRVTSRSPRSIDKHMVVDEAETVVKKAVYEHASEDWYRPGRDDIDLSDFD